MKEQDGPSTIEAYQALLTEIGQSSEAGKESGTTRPDPIEHGIPKAFSLICGGEKPKVCWQSFGHPTIFVHLSDTQIASFVEDGSAYLARKIREAAR
jgi:hypothetical protein